MKSITRITKRILSIVLCTAIVSTMVTGCSSSHSSETQSSVSMSSQRSSVIPSEEEVPPLPESVTTAMESGDEIDFDEVATELIRSEYSMMYDVFDAVIELEDGTEIPGIGYSDFSAYFEADDGSQGYFPAGFLVKSGEISVPSKETDNGLVVSNLEFEHDDYGFVYCYDTEPFTEHCVLDGTYLKYGIDSNGVIEYETHEYEKGVCDESLGSLYSYDDDKYVYVSDENEYKPVSGYSISESIDYDAIQNEINSNLEKQDECFAQVDVQSSIYISQETVKSYLLSMQEETFLNFRVEDLIAAVETLDPNQCIRFTPEGLVAIPVSDAMPGTASEFCKWLVGACCGVIIISSLAIELFIPAFRPFAAAISGAATEVFVQTVSENRSLTEIQWSKVAVASVSAAMLAWICPLSASTVTESVGVTTGSQIGSRMAGYGLLTAANFFVGGTTGAVFALIDEKETDEVWDAFWLAAAISGACTVTFCAIEEVAPYVMPKINAKLENTFFGKATKKITTFIDDHQVHLKNSNLEEFLNPKSIYQASEAAHAEFLKLNPDKRNGGKYSDLSHIRDGRDAHEMPSFQSTGADKRKDAPAIKMEPEDHRQTASYGSSNSAREYRARQAELVRQGKYHEAIQMDLDNLKELGLDKKYKTAIGEMLKYAESIGWW